ncbi:hypothetical protein A0J61_10816 [Choanephora cucurbitarum]|uniref:Uncharacterized protein n=1 Tax=Choanephora cucurbitarum TaxID=101091 RepID=A0A1C7MWE9_9FUNG|nr:hypothetical protein A0J61_10816 [Choanephora cucurbitarum]
MHMYAHRRAVSYDVHELDIKQMSNIGHPSACLFATIKSLYVMFTLCTYDLLCWRDLIPSPASGTALATISPAIVGTAAATSALIASAKSTIVQALYA